MVNCSPRAFISFSLSPAYPYDTKWPLQIRDQRSELDKRPGQQDYPEGTELESGNTTNLMRYIRSISNHWLRNWNKQYKVNQRTDQLTIRLTIKLDFDYWHFLSPSQPFLGASTNAPLPVRRCVGPSGPKSLISLFQSGDLSTKSSSLSPSGRSVAREWTSQSLYTSYLLSNFIQLFDPWPRCSM